MSVQRTSVIPDLIDGLISAATTALPNTTVTDGALTTYETGDYLLVGIDDPDVSRWVSATSTQEWAGATMATGRNEQATITCAVSTWSGDSQKAARDSAFSIAGTVQGLMRTQSTFSTVTGLLWATYARQTFTQWSDNAGFYTLLMFQIDTHSRI